MLKSIFKISSSRETTLEPFSSEGTVFLFDLGGSDLKAGMDPVTLVGEMNAVLAPAHQLILKHGGKIVSTVGDAMLALWADPVDDLPHAERALACGKEILARSREIQEKHECEFYLQIVLATGPVIVMLIGGRNQVYGKAMNVACRLEHLEKVSRSRVLCTSETLGSVPGHSFSKLATQVKGVAGIEVEVFELS